MLKNLPKGYPVQLAVQAQLGDEPWWDDVVCRLNGDQ